MGYEQAASGGIVDVITSKVRILNLTILLSVTVVLLLVARFAFSFLGYLGTQSVMGVLFMASVLALAVFYITGNVAGVAIRSIREYHEKLGAMSKIAREVHEIDHTDDLIENILSSAISLSGAEGGSLLMAEDDTLRFELVKGCCAEILTGLRMPRNEGIAGWVLESGTAVIANNARKDPRHSRTVDEITGFDTRSILCAPIRIRGEVRGVVELVSERADAFEHEDAEMMDCFLSQAAFAMTRARHSEEMKNFEIHMANVLVEAIEKAADKPGHLRRVARYALNVGRALNMNEEGLRMLHSAAMLHDIGLLRMDVRPGMPEGEYSAHALHGYGILREITHYRDIAPIVLHHHERYDGKGYPEGLSGQEIPLMSRIISIAEVFDAMTGSGPGGAEGGSGLSMPYPMDYSRAIIELRGNAGTRFDPALVGKLLDNMSEDDMEWVEEAPSIVDRPGKGLVIESAA